MVSLMERPKTQAERVFARFGSVTRLHRAMQRLPETKRRNISSLYRWNLPLSHGGSGGLVPSSAWRDVLEAARLEGILIRPEDSVPSQVIA